MIAAGAIARLNSGGPAMLVQAIEGGQATCLWANADGTLGLATFPPTSLTLLVPA